MSKQKSFFRMAEMKCMNKIPCFHNLMETIVVVVLVDLFQLALEWWVYVASFSLGGDDIYDI